MAKSEKKRSGSKEAVVMPFENLAVARVFEKYPPAVRRKLLALRSLIFKTASLTSGVGKLEESLKWGEPTYSTKQSKSGSPIRIDWKTSQPAQYEIFFHCQTNLIATFRALFSAELKFEGNRAIVLNVADALPRDAIALCITAALTYHLNKSRKLRIDPSIN
jgi:Domain of unknown function (DU1801)